MGASHFFIWAGISIVLLGVAATGWYLRQLWLGQDSTGKEIDRAISQQVTGDRELGVRIAAMEEWAKSYAAFHERASRQQSDHVGALEFNINSLREATIARFDGLNKRLVSIETENKEVVLKKRDEDDDPFAGPRSWAAQAAAAERGSGVRSVG